MGRLMSEPWVIGTIIVVAMLLFAAPKMPSMARNLGQSMRIFKSEVRELKKDETLQAGGPTVNLTDSSRAGEDAPLVAHQNDGGS
ncbi:twin-arginine translocase TatA/TatE family subunit [Arthrobacter sp. HS15c]|uniref:twin-arginine translocase TatA/TatE family subunit n=1 Tax=Arthrobacter sp. HS15c TaxID=3230279 RepID=UPI00346566F7